MTLAAVLSAAAGSASAEIGFGTLGTEIDDESGYRLFGALGGNISERTVWDVAAARSETSTSLSDFTTSALDGTIYHDFGRVGLRFGLGAWVDQDLVRADELSAALDFHGERWLFALETELRHSDFEPFEVDRTIVLRDGTLLPIRGTVSCSVDDVGLGARLSWSSGDWRVAIRGMSFDYDDYGCELGFRVIDTLASSTRDEFVQFADRLTDLLALGASRRIAIENSFLDSRLGLALSRDAGARTYNLYYDAIEEVFFGRKAQTLSAGIGFELRSGHEIEVYAGLTDDDLRSSVAFLGVQWLLAR